MRFEGARDRARAAIQENRDLALHVQAGKLVDVHFRNNQPVADENRRSVHVQREVGAQVERRIFT